LRGRCLIVRLASLYTTDPAREKEKSVSKHLMPAAVLAFGFLALGNVTPVASAQTFSDWTQPVNLGPTINTSSGEV